MTRKRARFDVVAIEITVHCPHCDSVVTSPIGNGDGFIWTSAAIAETASKDIQCRRGCTRWFRLPYSLQQLLKPSSEPVSSDRRVGVARIEIVCGTCAGDAQEPKLTLLTTDGRCSKCGGRNYSMVSRVQLNTNERERS
jgi:Zn finger protein HypA/HybF involved in hydrogenase expression